MKALVPNAGIEIVRKGMDRSFDRLREGDSHEPSAPGEWSPPLDRVETKATITARLDVRGMEPADLHLGLQEASLTIRGDGKVQRREKGKARCHRERKYGQRTRVVRLPAGVNPDKVVAAFRGGAITVSMPKLPEAKGTEIPIKAV